MVEYIKRLKLCIKWFQELEGHYIFEQEKLLNALESAKQNCDEMGIRLISFVSLSSILIFLMT